MTNPTEEVLSIEQLCLKSWEKLSPKEAEVVALQYEAIRTRRHIEATGTRLRFGMGNREQRGQTEAEMELEFLSFHHGTLAIVAGMEYLTQNKTAPMNERQYIELQKFVIDYLPRSVWDKGDWFKRFNKLVDEQNIPVDGAVQAYVEQNDRLFMEYMLADADFTLGGKDLSREEALQRASRMRIRTLTVDNDKLVFAAEQELEPLSVEKDARQIYRILTGDILPSELG